MKIALALFLLVVALTGCGHKKVTKRIPSPPSRTSKPPVPPGTSGNPSTPSTPTPPAPVPEGYTETGVASWYGYPYHGRPAANGEIYDMEKLVAAHRTLPFDTWVRVYDLDNDRNVEVRIIDRGPFVDGRVIDLSRAAARALAMLGPGTAQVRLEVIQAPAWTPAPVYAVQIGAYNDRERAERVRAEMEAKHGAARLVERAEDPGIWRVMVGRESTQDAANSLCRQIRKESGEKKAFVVRLDSE